MSLQIAGIAKTLADDAEFSSGLFYYHYVQLLQQQVVVVVAEDVSTVGDITK